MLQELVTILHMSISGNFSGAAITGQGFLALAAMIATKTNGITQGALGAALFFSCSIIRNNEWYNSSTKKNSKVYS